MNNLLMKFKQVKDIKELYDEELDRRLRLEKIIQRSSIKKEYKVQEIDNSNVYVVSIFFNGEFYHSYMGYGYEIKDDIRQLEKSGYEFLGE